MKVVVLMGGWSAEREVSLMSGAGIAAAARTLGHHVTEIDMGCNVAADLAAAAPDVVFNALHGTPGEDGSVQGLLEIMGLAYTHSGVTASALAIDKQLTKAILVPAGVRMPQGHVVTRAQLHAADPLPRPYVLKPLNEGSSVGVAIVTDQSNHGQPINPASPGPWSQFETLLAEPFIPGHELTVAVIDDGQGPRALAVTELKARSGFYDYDAKYTEGLTEHICPAQIPADIAASAMAMAEAGHRLLGCRGTSRADFRWDETQGEAGLFLLEINTQPGMTPLSLVPEQAAHVGISYPALVQLLLDAAIRDHRA